MKNSALFFAFVFAFLFFAQRSNAQCYVRLEDASGLNTDAYQDTLQAAAARLCAIFDTTGFQGQFKVYDFGFYLHQENTMGGYPEPFAQKIAEVQGLSPYYLLFGKQTDKSGVYTKFWVDLVLPDTSFFYCIDLSQNLRDNLKAKYQIIANTINDINGKVANLYHKSEVATIDSLYMNLLSLKECCIGSNRQLRSYMNCISCGFSQNQFEILLSDYRMDSKIFPKIIKTSLFPPIGEQIGYAVLTENNDTINIDNAITIFKQAILEKAPNLSIKAYTFSYEETCSNFDYIRGQFLSDNVDVGILVGVVGGNGNAGKVFWQTICNDDDLPTSPATTSDSVYLFQNSDFPNVGKYIKRELGQGYRKGAWLDRCGIGCNYEFSFADPINYPWALRAFDIPLGQDPPRIGSSIDNYWLNKIRIMNKDDIFGRLTLSKALDPEMKRFCLPWLPFSQSYELWLHSSGWDQMFDYSTKDFFANQVNYLFITDDGDYIVAHDYRNMGNFLWGATTYIMGVPKAWALAGAHLNNLNAHDYEWDSDDDQWSIQLGRIYAKKMGWKTIYGGRQNIFRN